MWRRAHDVEAAAEAVIAAGLPRTLAAGLRRGTQRAEGLKMAVPESYPTAGIVTGIDDYSRFGLATRLVFRDTAQPVCEALAQAPRTYGVPEQLLHRYRQGPPFLDDDRQGGALPQDREASGS